MRGVAMPLHLAWLPSTRPDQVRSSGRKHSCQSDLCRFHMLHRGTRSKRISERSSDWRPLVTSGDKRLCNSDRVVPSCCKSTSLMPIRHFSLRAARAAAMPLSHSRMLNRIRTGKRQQATSNPAMQLTPLVIHSVTPGIEGTK